MARLKYLLDTNILSERARRCPDLNVGSRLAAHAHEACTAAPVLHELEYGLVRMPDGLRKQELAGYLKWVLRLEILPYDREAARWHAEERARLTGRGRTPPFVDGQIAAIAATNGLTLVTRNTGDFDGFTDLTVENWFA